MVAAILAGCGTLRSVDARVVTQLCKIFRSCLRREPHRPRHLVLVRPAVPEAQVTIPARSAVPASALAPQVVAGPAAVVGVASATEADGRPPRRRGRAKGLLAREGTAAPLLVTGVPMAERAIATSFGDDLGIGTPWREIGSGQSLDTPL
eukprot:CAMPEP_0195065960 /NCGR_PEP_ID=MMETSP0448-20130528/11442_1 /TAXON_ID=66468 /ORGANISM="Heterocapsa triquestra, Strain CCMP 448" /LENGTH=149 /DNA_ID=CAMNT_0040097125 /DNA_START=394 /DNA_END=844 /DNA_ORIENTATION=-